MTVSIVVLAMAYAFLLFLVVIAILKSEIGTGLKLLLAALCLGFYLWHYDALQSYPGWPADEGLPQHFELVGSFTVEPDSKNNESGAVYLWVRDLEGVQAVPRSYRLPYQKTLHRKVDETLRKQQAGERYVGSPVPGGAGKAGSVEFEAVQRDTGEPKSSLQ